MKLNWQTVSRILGGILLALLVWLGKQAAVQLLSIQKELAAINVQLAEVRNSGAKFLIISTDGIMSLSAETTMVISQRLEKRSTNIPVATLTSDSFSS